MFQETLIVRRTPNRTAASGNRLHLFRAMAFTLIAVSTWVMINMQNLQEFIETRQKREHEREQIDVLTQRIKRLKRQQQSLAYNGVESEKQIRERLGMHLRGEKVIFLKDGPPSPNSSKLPELAPVEISKAEKPKAGEKTMALNKTQPAQ